ncbi:Non-hem dioxygenase N-terminal domain [Dillenia turbinata]|uniref:Non-hem dioxygenase N-terminal domain n=1 Tax=Dillenia turbinata TaxID=194707 RepID=A0AAN8W485_9MAGN
MASPAAPLVIPAESFIKTLAESPNLTSIPSTYTYSTTPLVEPVVSGSEASIPIIDFSLLTSGSPDRRSQAIHDLGKACQDWGFFMVTNHGIPEGMIKGMIEGLEDFFNLREEEKKEFRGKHVLDPIRCGTSSFNTSAEQVFFWRDFLRVFVHPDFHFPNKPLGVRELSHEYCKRVREVYGELIRGISTSLGLEESYIHNTLNMEDGLQILVGNFYPPCPQPELAMGLPPHSDLGFLTLLIENQIGGLQIQHNHKWVNVKAIPNSFLVNTSDQLEILSNGKYKSNVHRATVNNKATRVSIAMANGPSLEDIVGPAPELIDNESNPPRYMPMKYKDYMELQQSNRLDGKTCLDCVKIQRDQV